MRKILMRSGITPFNKYNPSRVMLNDSIGGNSGNLVYAYGAYRALMTEDTKFVSTHYRLDYSQEEIDKINEEYDCFVIPLADAFREDYIGTLKATTRLIRQLKIPSIVIGVGLRAPFEPDLNEDFPFDNAVKEFMDAVLDKSAIVGVRGQITSDYLTKLGYIEGKHHMIIGCPSMYMFGRDLSIRETNITKDSFVCINNSILSPDNVLDFMDRSINEFENGYFIPQRLNELKTVYFGIPYSSKDKIALNYPHDIDHYLYEQDRVRFFTNFREWSQFISEADFTFGARLHGNIASVVSGTPSLVIPKDARMREVVEYHNLTSVTADKIKDDTSIWDLIEKADFQAPIKNQHRNFDNYRNFLKLNELENIFENEDNPQNTPFDKQVADTPLQPAVTTYNSCSEEEKIRRTREYIRCSNRVIEDLNTEVKSLKQINAQINGMGLIKGVTWAVGNNKVWRNVGNLPPIKQISGHKKERKKAKKETYNRRHMKKFLHHAIPEAYDSCRNEPVDERKVVFIEPRYNTLSNNFIEIYKTLENEYDFNLKVCMLKELESTKEEFEQNCIDMAKEVATAKYVFLDEASRPFSAVNKRKETIATQLWHGCGAFKKFGFSTADLLFGSDAESMREFPFYANLNYVTVSSPEVTWAYEEAMMLKDGDTEVVATGVSRTDNFFKDDTIKNAYEKLYSLMPSAKGKKVILYAPTFRGRVRKARTPNRMNLGAFSAELSDEYVLLFKHHPIVKKRPKVTHQYKDFARDMTDDMTIDELLCVSDICISDYSSLVFEYSLFERPMIFFAYDIDEYNDWRGFYYDYDELTPGPVYETNEEIINYIKNIDTMFDKQRVIDFKNKFMCSCDGHATERILKMAFGDALEANKRVKPN